MYVSNHPMGKLVGLDTTSLSISPHPTYLLFYTYFSGSNRTHFYCDSNWKSYNGKGCKDYIDEKFCTENGTYGDGWMSKWGKFDKWSDARGRTALVCPQCGCVEGIKPGMSFDTLYHF